MGAPRSWGRRGSSSPAFSKGTAKVKKGTGMPQPPRGVPQPHKQLTPPNSPRSTNKVQSPVASLVGSALAAWPKGDGGDGFGAWKPKEAGMSSPLSPLSPRPPTLRPEAPSFDAPGIDAEVLGGNSAGNITMSGDEGSVPLEERARRVPPSRLADPSSPPTAASPAPPPAVSSGSGGRLSAKSPGAKLAAVRALNRLQLTRFGDFPDALGTPTSPSGNRSPGAQSHCTNALRHSQSEWWVIQQPGRDFDDDELETEEDTGDTSSRPFSTWCGEEPALPSARRTPVWSRGLFGPLRRTCSGRRNRYDFGGFDLDLTYVTSRVIAMSFPSKGLEAAFRNPHSDVVKFLSQEHGENYRVYNLCGEQSHSSNGFPSSQTVHFPCADHCPPTLPMLAEFCRDVEDWLRTKDENVVVVHCKAGKGRTGTHICALLVFARAFASAYEALLWYEVMRGGTRSGVTIPDQIRWVAMLERWFRYKDEGLNSNPMGPPNAHRLRSVRMGPMSLEMLRGEGSGVDGGSSASDCAVSLSAAVSSRADVARRRFTHQYPLVKAVVDEHRMLEVMMPEGGPVWEENDGMLQVVLITKVQGMLKSSTLKKKMQVWWHHSFLQRIPGEGGAPDTMEVNVPKVWILGLHKDLVKNKKAPPDFKFSATFEDVVHGPIVEETASAVAAQRTAPALLADALPAGGEPTPPPSSPSTPCLCVAPSCAFSIGTE
mmetsp:Transcript_35229/g.114050  ORF Transcript_35229/g.114050 Transcript_35229/m.114050 type:complete len:711 (-) Transcript_35229:59-2191(-)